MTIDDDVAERVLSVLRRIEAMKAERKPDDWAPGAEYARALGSCIGLAMSMADSLERYMRQPA